MTEQTQASAAASARDEFERVVAEKAAQDPEFKKRLLANPKEALKTTFGVEIPKDVELHVLEETPSRFYLVLPIGTQELSDEELEKAAGGVGTAVAFGALGGLASHKESIGLKLSGKMETGFLK